MELGLKIKKRSVESWLVWFIFFMPFLFGTFLEFLNLPSLVKYTIDLAWVGIVILFIFSQKITVCKSSSKLFLWILAFFLYTLVMYLFNFQSPFYYLWGFRNNFRMYAFFIGATVFLYQEEIDSYLGWFDRIFYVNCAVALFQFFILDLRQDYLGGIFGAQQGCNGWLNIFQVAVVTKAIIYYLNKKEKIGSVVIKCALSLIIAAFAELRFFFAEFAIIVAVAVLITAFSWRKVVIIGVTTVSVIVGIRLIVEVFPDLEGLMTLEGFYNIASSEDGYTSSGDMNRLTSLSMASDLFLKTDGEKLFGLGLGNCDYAEAFSFLTSPFYLKNSGSHYTWLSTAFIFLETGFVGLVFVFGFFAMVFLMAFRRMRKTNKLYCHISMVTAVCCVLIGIYNSSLRTEAAFMLYFLLALPFVGSKEKTDELI